MTGRLIVAIGTTVLEEGILVAIALWGLPQFDIYVPLGILIAIMAAWAANAIIFYQIGSRALRRKHVLGLGTMVGSKGKAINSLIPDGVVKIMDELWEARATSGRIGAGEEITVLEQDGLRLIVVKTVVSKENNC